MTDNKNSPAEMSFSEFAEIMKPSGAVNRFPAVGVGPDVYSYTVYMNGPLNAGIPNHSLENTFKDVMLHALTEKLELNSSSARDNLKVAEVVALRGAWMSSVLERSSDMPLSPEVVKDYEVLAEGLTHPWIVAQLDAQRALMSRLQPALLQANIEKDIVPRELSIGKILAQDGDFTFQKTMEGEVVTHENRRLDELPAVGADVSVSYYRGHGQVVPSLENLKVSPPFIDPIDDNLAVMLEDGRGLEQVVLFNSLASFEKFVVSHDLNRDLVHQAMDARKTSQKLMPPSPAREAVSLPYVDKASGCIAVDFKEGNGVRSVLFQSAFELDALASDLGLDQNAIDEGHRLENSRMSNVPSIGVSDLRAKVAESDFQDKLKAQGYQNFKPAGVEGESYIGKVVEVGPMHVAQDIGRRVLVLHDKRSLDKLPEQGDVMVVQIQNGRGIVEDLNKGAQSVGR